MNSVESYIHNNPSLRRSPISHLSPEQFEQARGKVVALLLAGQDRGTLIAQAPIDPMHPSEAWKSVREQVAASVYSGRHHQLREVLPDIVEA